MLNMKEKVALAPFTTMGIGGNAEFFAEISQLPKLREAVLYAKEKSMPITILGGGSNVLIKDGMLQGLVLRIALSGVTYAEIGTDVYVTAGAGVVLDELISETVTRGMWGLENLSAIPGYVGATPIQNVGAYGVEVSDLITSVVAYDTLRDEYVVLSNRSCSFQYRDSLFKREEGRHYIVVWVTYKLSKTPQPKLSYKDIERYFKGITAPSLLEIRRAVIEIRSRKFPDWRKIGTAGSFFKNPILTEDEFQKLRGTFPNLPGFPLPGGQIKIPLGYVLDKILGLKGYREGNVGLYSEQALVLIADRGANAKEVNAFAEKMVKRVKDATGIDVVREVTNV